MAQFSLMSIEELKLRGPDELARLLKTSEQDKIRITAEQSRAMKEVNRKLQVHALENRNLRELNEKLETENEELRQICCSLDDDREKDERLVDEWQKFGRYTTNVMKNDVTTFHKKLDSLESRLDVLMKENIELKELCLVLAEERNETARDRGDGSSGSSPLNERQMTSNRDDEKTKITNGDDVVRYQRFLESKVARLEEENTLLLQLQSMTADGKDYRKFVLTAEPSQSVHQKPTAFVPVMTSQQQRHHLPSSQTTTTMTTQQIDDTNVNAMKVLNLHEQMNPLHSIEKDFEVMDESEKAIVRQMCNVVWRKLGGTVPGYKTAV